MIAASNGADEHAETCYDTACGLRELAALRDENERLRQQVRERPDQEAIDMALSRAVLAERELAALRRPVVQSREIEAIRKTYRLGPGTHTEIERLLSALDQAQREIQQARSELHDMECSKHELSQVNEQQRQALKLLVNEDEPLRCIHCNGKGVSETFWKSDVEEWHEAGPCETCRGTGKLLTAAQYLKTVPADWNKDSSLETWFPLTAEQLERQAKEIAALKSPPEERAEISSFVRDYCEPYPPDSRVPLLIGYCKALLADLTRLRNAHQDRVAMLAFVQGELNKRNAECVELRERCERLEMWPRLYAGLMTDYEVQKQRIERLEGALRLVLPMAKGWAAANPVGANQQICNDAEAVCEPQ